MRKDRKYSYVKNDIFQKVRKCPLNIACTLNILQTIENITLLQKSKTEGVSKNNFFLIVSNYYNLMIDSKIVFRNWNICPFNVNSCKNFQKGFL